MSVNGKALSAVAVGGLFLWSGIKGFSVLGTVGDIIKGGPASQGTIYPLTADELGSSFQVSGGFSGGGGAGIAQTALRYEGHAYRYGGAPGRQAQNPWDCSSMVNFVVGVERGMAIPGYATGRYDGSSHGPSTPQWAIWPGTQKISRAEVQAGDIIVWVGHMGIAIDNTRYISALNPKTTTKITTIDNFGHTPVRFGRFL